jgi:transcriptional regulator with XRE-family HTH domain
MQKRPIQRGRPTGATSFEAAPAVAFGAAVRAARTAQGIAQETLAYRAGVERSHMGKIERGEHLPTLALVLKIAAALDCSAAELVATTEASLPKGWFSPNREG